MQHLRRHIRGSDDMSGQTRYRRTDIQQHTLEPRQLMVHRPSVQAEQVHIVDNQVFEDIPEILQLGLS